MKTRYFFRMISVLIVIVAVLFLVPISSASQEFEDVNIFLFGKTDIMTIHGFHDFNSGYGADSLIYMDYHGPYIDKALCKIWNAEEKLFDDVLSFKRVTMNNFTGWIYFHPNFPILFGYCEYIRLNTLRGTASVELI